jgi:hypothetical protein
MNTSPDTKPTAAGEQGESAVDMIDNIHACLHAAAAVASLLDLAFEVKEVNSRNGTLHPQAEEISEPSALIATRAIRAIEILLEGVKEDADQLFERARHAPQAEAKAQQDPHIAQCAEMQDLLRQAKGLPESEDEEVDALMDGAGDLEEKVIKTPTLH